MASSNIFDYIHMLPLEIRRTIFYYIPCKLIQSDATRLIRNVIDVYTVDHDPELTRYANMYFVKNIMPFWEYVFVTLYECQNERPGCKFGRPEYDTLSLSPKIIYELTN